MHMAVFTLVVAVVVSVLFKGIQRAFMANAGLNSLIVGALLLGVFYAFRMVWRLGPEINWVNGFRAGLTNAENPAKPRMLAPMAALLGDQEERSMLSTNAVRAMLDSLAARLDESRDQMRYMVGLLIFLGLLGTFWGLLETVTSIGDAISSLDVTAAQSSSMFDQLKSNLAAPLGGMGLSFAASLFGLAGSLILGFYDLKLGQAQNRFYHNLEDWLSTITDIGAGESGQSPVSGVGRLELQGLQRGLDRLSHIIEMRGGMPAGASSGSGNGKSDSIEELADAVASLVQQMRDEQKAMRQWAQSQQVQQNEIQRLLIRATGQQAPSTRARIRGEE
jgi:hypothetical protein